jgi:hypothetical protein
VWLWWLKHSDDFRFFYPSLSQHHLEGATVNNGDTQQPQVSLQSEVEGMSLQVFIAHTGERFRADPVLFNT